MNKSIIYRFIAIILCGVLIFGSACGKETDTPEPDGKTVIDDTEIVLCENGQTEYIIVLPTERTPVVEYVAEEISLFLYESTGARLKIETDKNVYNSDSKVISVGKAKLKGLK